MSAPFPVTGKVSLLAEDAVDTDIIYPARFLLLTEKAGLGRYAFADRRDDAEFPLPTDGSSPILVAGANFGCGSSREHAVWALHDFGTRVVIAPSFGEIFYVNCTRNGILPVRLPAEEVDRLAQCEGAEITVDLEKQEVRAAGMPPIGFDIDTGYREALLKGWDETMRILATFESDIDAYEAQREQAQPWL